MKEYRPWGWYEVLLEEDNYKVKRIWINPGQQLSLQSHQMREEYWVVVKGRGSITLGKTKAIAQPGEYFHVPVGVLHRMQNTGREPLVFIETQTGTYFGEDDIERFSDQYGRA